MSLSRFGVTHPVPVNLLMTALLIGGIAAGFALRREFFPEIEPEAAVIALPYPGATPEEIEQTLALKVEDALAELDETDRLITTLSEGGGGITLEFREGVDVREAVDEAERAIDALTDLPDEAERITVTELEARLPVAMVSVYGDAGEEAIKQAIRGVRDDLKALPDMGEVLVSGVRDYEIRVDVRAEALLEHGVSLPQVSEAIRRWMADLPGGAVRGRSGNIQVRTLGVRERAEAIRQIVVKASPAGQALRVGEIAEVSESFVDEQVETRHNGQPSASLTIMKVGEQDIVRMAGMIRAYVQGRRGEPLVLRGLERLRGEPRQIAHAAGVAAGPMPPGLSITVYSDLARFVEQRLELLTKNALYGAILVFGTLLVFLNWRVAMWVGTGLLTALAGTLMLMYWTGTTLNLLTMFGLIVVLGILVDDAIVVAENIQARHDRGETSLVAAIRGAGEVGWPVVATVLTTIVAFLPLTFVRGNIGDLLGALPMVVTCALLMSLLECMLILPSHMGHSLVHRDRAAEGRVARAIRGFEQGRDRIIQQRVIPAYAWLLDRAMQRRYLSVVGAVALVIISSSLLAGGRLEFVFLPSEDSETIVVDVRMPLGTAIERTGAVVARIEQAARAQPETQSIGALIGESRNLETGTTEVAATHLGQVYIELKPVELRDREGMRPSSEVIAGIRAAAGVISDAERIAYSEISGGPVGADMTIELRGADEQRLVAATAELKVALERYEGVYDVYDDSALGQRELQIELKPGAAALGFTVADVAAQVRGALHGLEAHVFSAEQEDIDVRVRLDEPTRRSLTAIEELWLISPAGDAVPLLEIAELIDGTSYATIRRIDRQRAVTVTAETAPQVSPETITADISANVLPGLRARHPRVEFTFAGRQKQMMEAFSSLPLGFLAAMIMIYVILAWLFASYTQPIAVMLAVPFAVVGVFWGHLLLGFDVTFLSLIGFVALSGVVVNDSLILMEFYNVRRRDGLGVREALLAAGRQRLRPIFLTTVTTVFGLTPLMLETSFQARFLIPMAISISFGLISATVLILLVLPCIVLIVEDVKDVAHFMWHGRRRESARPRAVADLLGEA